jgi:hypothetical protein
MTRPEYNRQYRGVKLDPYRILSIYGIEHPAHQHALKKLLRAGRSHKELAKDISEVIETLKRWQEMIEEDLTTKEGR